ncbi:GNAT domain-containing protein [Aspergillus coremiiformis]|uniref:GNAT domain-containing protein n=1 Tax=Aspergillus coremiiformis TaxID=138285 RepID=A0A5N6Z2E8_9EURO|nr:GNAT domain-containing protein [Aspergillus coremiiformis]
MQTSRLELVRLTVDHVPGYHTIWSDPIAARWSAHGPCQTMEDSREWMSSLLLDANPMGENYAILLNDSHPHASLAPGRFIGWVGTWRTDPVPEVGLIFHRSTWGWGFATEALRAFVNLFWTCKPQFNLLEAYCDTENEASIKVLRKCGFKLVEVTRGDYVLPWMTPSNRDTMRFRLVRPDQLAK